MTREILYREALREALREELRRDPRVFLIGEDIADPFGGSNKVTLTLSAEFGQERVRCTPIAESAIIGAAAGAAMTGMRPVAEIMYIDFITLAMDQIVNQVAKFRYMSGGQVGVPLVIRCQSGAGRQSGAQHSQSLEAWFMHVPGLKVVLPSDPYDAKGLLKAAIRDDDPVIFIEHRMLYLQKGPVPEEEYIVPLGQAAVKRAGSDVTVVAISRMVGTALKAAETLQAQGVSIEVIDPRSIVPLDKEAILASLSKTHRIVIAHEACERGGFGAEVAAWLAADAFDLLDAPIVRVATPNVPIPFAPALEKSVVPDEEAIVRAVRSLL
jgi:pyruvate/2-oxoglutarate/acetoin dehydrogenase E1 component